MNNRHGFALSILIGAALALTACAQTGAGDATVQQQYPPSEFAHRVASPAVELFWNCNQASNAVLFQGIAFNQWFAGEVLDLKLELVGVDAGERTVSNNHTTEAFRIGTMRSAPFQLTVQPAGSEVRYDLYYQYQYREPGDRDTGEKHTDRRPAAPILLASSGPFMLAQVPPTSFLARDVCSPNKLRAR
jgi:hypothetical protein